MSHNRGFLRFQAGQWIANAIAGGIVDFQATGVQASGFFGGFQLQAATIGHSVVVTWRNTAAVTPVIGWAPIVATTLVTALGGQGGHRFLRIGGVASTAASIGLYNGTTTSPGTVHIAVFGIVRSDGLTTF